MDCFKFQVNLPFDSIFSGLNSLNCSFVTDDNTCFDDGFDNEIFVGNAQFVTERRFLDRRQFEIECMSDKINFRKRPLHKSCFTSLDKLCYKHFCTNCKKFYNEMFEEDLYILFRIDNE